MMIERVKELEQQLSGDLRQLEQRLLAELGATFSELQALVQICMERADGHDPNISILLGVKSKQLSVNISSRCNNNNNFIYTLE